MRIASCPDAEVLLDGEAVGSTPLEELRVSSGTHTLTLRRDGFEEKNLQLDLGPDRTRSIDEVLIAEDPTDPEALAALGRDLEIDLAVLEEPETFRSRGAAVAIQPLYPRGAVRPEDLVDFRVDVTEDFEPGGKLQFRKGSNVLWERIFEPDSYETVEPIPTDVKSAIEPGKSYSWGYHPEKGRAVAADFKVVKPDPRLEERLRQIEERLSTQNPLVVRQMRAQLLLNKRLYQAAYREAKAVADQCEEAPQAYAIMQAALRRMKLHKSALWAEVDGMVRRRGRHVPIPRVR